MARQLPALKDELFLSIAAAVRSAILGAVQPYQPQSRPADPVARYEMEMREMEREAEQLFAKLHGRH